MYNEAVRIDQFVAFSVHNVLADKDNDRYVYVLRGRTLDGNTYNIEVFNNTYDAIELRDRLMTGKGYTTKKLKRFWSYDDLDLFRNNDPGVYMEE